MATIKKLKEIDTYLSTADFPLLLYSMLHTIINNKMNEGKNIVVFQFNSVNNLLNWLKNGTNKGNNSIMFMSYNEASIVIDEKHKHVIVRCDSSTEYVGIVITCPTNNNEQEFQCSVSCFGRVTNSSLFNEINCKYPQHIESLVIINS